MSEENSKKIRKFYKKKRYILPIGFFLFCAYALVSGSNITNKLIEECNEGKNEKCDDLIENWSSYVSSEDDRAKITNPYFFEKLKESEERKAEEEKKKAKEKAEEKRKIEEANRRKAEQGKRANEMVSKMKLCKKVLKQSLKDPNSYKELNTILEQFQTGIIRYTATNSFGGRIQQVFKCKLN